MRGPVPRDEGPDRDTRSIVVVADSSFIADTVRLALRDAAGLDVVGKLDGRASVAPGIRQHRPDVVVVDEMQRPRHALDRIRECRGHAPDAAIVALSVRMDESWVGQALAAGADACVSKLADLPSLGTLVREIASRNVVSSLAPVWRDDHLTLEGKERLTAREREILTLVADGLTNSRISRQLGVTEQTVKFHLSNIYRKLGVTNRTEASRYVHMPGLAKRPLPQLVPGTSA